MSRLSRATRRTGAVAAVSLALAWLPAAGAAYAATGTVTQSSPAFVANTGSATRVAFTLSSAPTSPGEVLDVRLSGPAGNTIAETGTPDVDGSTVSATFDLRGAPPGVYGVTVADVSGAVDDYTCASCLRVLATPPTVSGVTPSVRGASSPAAAFTVTGTNLFQGVSVKFLRAGSADPTIAYPATGGLTVGADGRTVTGTLAVAPSAVPGVRDVEVTNTDGQRAICEGCLTITPAPSFVSLSPAVIGQGAVARSMTLVGADFQPAMSAMFFTPNSTTDQGGIVVTSFAVADDGSATITANAADRGDTVPVKRDLVLTNPDGGQMRIADALTLNPEPVVTALSPSTLDGGAVNESLTVTGTGLSANPVMEFSGTGVTVHDYTPDTATAATKGVLEVSVAPGAATGGRTLTIVNPDGGRSTSGTVLTVGATPTVTSVTPSALGRGAASRTVTIAGSGFDTGGVAVTIPGVTVSAANATSATSITATVSVPAQADLGARDVSVLNTAAGRRGRATCAGCFSVDSFSVDSITPSAVLNSATYRLDVTGSGLPAGETVTATLTRNVARAGQDPIVFDGEVNGDGTRFTGLVDLRDVAPGGYTLRLAKGDAVGTCTCVFSVVAERAPALTSVSPSSLAQGTQGRELTLTGAGFSRGTDVRFGTGVTKAGDVTFVDSTTLRVPVNVDPAAPTGAVAVTVLVPGFGADSEATCATCLTVTKRPTVTSSSRPSRGQGAPAVGVTLTGTEFQPGLTVSAGDGVTVSDVVRVSATSVTFNLAVADDAEPGARTITVTNPDGGEGSCACLMVTPKPLTSSVTPANGAQGANGVEVTLRGTGYQPGALVSFGDDVIVTNVSGSGDTLTATLDLRAANTGAHQVSVTNGDGGSATCGCSFTVYVPPTISGLTPASRGAGSIGERVSIMGTNFTESATVAFADPGITVTELDVVDAFRIDAVLTIAPDVAPGARSVTVTNLDTDQATSCTGCFTVNAAPTLSAADVDVQRGAKDVVLTLTGSGWQPGAVEALLGSGITVTDAQALTATSVRVTFDVSSSAPTGARDVTVVNGDGGRATCASCLTVTAPAAALATAIDDFRTSRSVLVAGETVTMRGTLRDSAGKALSGQPIRIYVTGGGFSSWVLWHTTSTGADGAFSKTATMTRTRSIKAVFVPGTEAYTRADSDAVQVGVRTRLSISAPKTATAGKAFSVRGSTYPRKPGKTVYLFWRKADGSVSILRRATVDRDGKYVLSRALSRGTYTLQVAIAVTAGNLSGRSAYVTVRVS